MGVRLRRLRRVVPESRLGRCRGARARARLPAHTPFGDITSAQIFQLDIPHAVITAERGDPNIEPMVRRIVEQWQADEPAQSSSDKLINMDWLRLQDGIVRQVRYVARTVFLPGPPHVVSMPLPRQLSFAYIPIKLAHDFVALPLWQAFRQALAPVGRLPYAFAASEIALAVIPASTETKLTIRRYRRAQRDAQRTLARTPNDPAALRDLGDALVGLRRHRDAIACYDKALAYAPHDTTIWKRRLAAIQGDRRHDRPSGYSARFARRHGMGDLCRAIVQFATLRAGNRGR